jgi:DtxR family Mn-dependent transcriptional regulator
MTIEPDLSSPGTTSESEEMYLITVARAAESGATGPIPVAKVAGALKISVASANEMVRKLTSRELLEYEPYRGVRLTPLGARVAQRVLRTRRLWSTFLVEHLGLTPEEADDQACLLEHVTLPDAVDRLASFLGDPETSPLGRPIPGPESTSMPAPQHPRLSAVAVGTTVTVIQVDAPRQAVAFLTGEGVTPGAVLTVQGSGEAGVLVRTHATLVHVGTDLAAAIEVQQNA